MWTVVEGFPQSILTEDRKGSNPFFSFPQIFYPKNIWKLPFGEQTVLEFIFFYHVYSKTILTWDLPHLVLDMYAYRWRILSAYLSCGLMLWHNWYLSANEIILHALYINSMWYQEPYFLIDYYFLNADYSGRNSRKVVKQHMYWDTLQVLCMDSIYIYFEQILVCNNDTTITKPDTDKS